MVLCRTAGASCRVWLAGRRDGSGPSALRRSGQPNRRGASAVRRRDWSSQLKGAPDGSSLAAPSVDYDKIREEARSAFASKAVEVKGYVSKLRKAQAAAEVTLDMSPPCPLRGPPPGKARRLCSGIADPAHERFETNAGEDGQVLLALSSFWSPRALRCAISSSTGGLAAFGRKRCFSPQSLGVLGLPHFAVSVFRIWRVLVVFSVLLSPSSLPLRQPYHRSRMPA